MINITSDKPFTIFKNEYNGMFTFGEEEIEKSIKLEDIEMSDADLPF